MLAFLSDYSSLEKFFAVCAAVGGLLFVIRLILQFVGGDSDAGDMDFDADFDVDVDAPDVGDGADFDSDTDLSFKALSFQGITAFAMMFGIDQGFAMFFGGTSLLIMVGVILDTLQQIESHLLMRHYDGLMKSGKIKGRAGGTGAAI